jgi:hypothetical protein
MTYSTGGEGECGLGKILIWATREWSAIKPKGLEERTPPLRCADMRGGRKASTLLCKEASSTGGGGSGLGALIQSGHSRVSTQAVGAVRPQRGML